MTFLTGILVAFGTGCSHQETAAQAQASVQPKPPAPTDRVDLPAPIQAAGPAQETQRRISTPQPAHVAPYEQTDLYAKVSGYLDSFGQIADADGVMRSVDIGARVAKGDVLAVLSVPELEQEQLQKAAIVEQAEGEVEQAAAAALVVEAMIEAAQSKIEETRAQLSKYDAELAYRKSEYERIAALAKTGAVRQELADEKLNQLRAAEAAREAIGAALATTQANLRVEEASGVKAKADLVTAKAQLKVSQANREHTAILLNYATIKAPYDGIVTRRLCDTGSFIQSAASGTPAPLFTMARVDRLRIISDVSESEAGQVQIGLPVMFHANGFRGQPLAGKVVRLADAFDAATRTMRVEIELDQPSPLLRPGMFGSISLVYSTSAGEQ